MLKNEDLPPALRDEENPPQIMEELPLEEPPVPAEPQAQTPPPADPYLRRG